MKSILLRKLGDSTIRQRSIDGYINATEMCDLSENKKVYQWSRLKNTDRLFKEISIKTGVSQDKLLITKKGGKDQGSWIHPNLAIAFAAWISPRFAIAVIQWVKDWEQQKKNIKDRRENRVETEEAMALAEWASKDIVGFSPALTHSLKLQAFAQLRPDLAHAIKPISDAIAQKSIQPDQTYTPTEIGAFLGNELGIGKISAIAVNHKLVEIGYQESVKRTGSNGLEKHHYFKPTITGKRYGQIELSAFKSQDANVTRPNCRWYKEIVGVLFEHWEIKEKEKTAV